MFQRKKHFQQYTDEALILALVEKKCAHTIPILYERYAHLVLGVCLKYLRQRENAEDTCILIFTQLEEKFNKHKIDYFKGWLFQVTRNACLQQLRKKDVKSTEINESTFIQAENEEDEREIIAFKEKQLLALEEAIIGLKEEQQICIRLFYIENKSYQEISSQLDLSLNTVKSAIQNGKRNLKLALENNENK